MGSDEGDAFKTKIKPKKEKKKKRKKKKTPKRKKKRDKTKPSIKTMIIKVREHEIKHEKWNTDAMYAISAKKKKTNKKCTIGNLKQMKTYILRMRLLNESGWSQYSKLIAIKTPKNIIKSKILTSK